MTHARDLATSTAAATSENHRTRSPAARYHARPRGHLPPSPTTAARLDPNATDRGAIFTRPDVVTCLLDLAAYTLDHPLHTYRLLEPSFGAGDILLPAIDRLLAAFTRAGHSPRDAARLADNLRAVEIHQTTFTTTRDRVHARLLAWGAPPRAADKLCDTWLLRADFLLAPLPGHFDVVVGNPPYVRQERIAAPQLAEYRRRYATIYDRADLYIPFFERGLQLLGPTGRLAFICANRWLKNRYGGPLRALIAGEYHLTHYLDMAGADAFHTEVSAYPAITVLRRGPGTRTRVARSPARDDSLAALTRLLTTPGTVDDPRIVDLEHVARGSEPWLLDAAADIQLIRRLERDFPTLEQCDCKVGIGVATGADRVFIGDHATLPVEPTRKLPLVMARDLQAGQIAWRGHGIINPFEPDGSLAPLTHYRAFAAHLRKHRQTLAARHVARRTGEWYRTIDRIHADLTTTPKLLVPDIKGEPMVVFDAGHYYPHHNLYHVTSSAWDLQALATILRSSIAVLFVSTYCVKMSGGFLRFQAQYLRRIRVPPWHALPQPVRDALIAAPPTDRDAIDRATFTAYGLTPAEARTARQCADAALVPRKSS